MVLSVAYLSNSQEPLLSGLPVMTGSRCADMHELEPNKREGGIEYPCLFAVWACPHPPGPPITLVEAVFEISGGRGGGYIIGY